MSRLKFPGLTKTSRKWLTHSATIAFISAICIAVLGHDMLRTWEARSYTIEQSQREIENLALSAAHHAEAAFEMADARLAPLVDRVEIDGIGPPQLARLRRLMALQLNGSAALQGLTLIDETGFSIVDAKPETKRVDLTDREFFRYHSTHSDRGSHVGPVILSRISGKWVIPVSRRIDHADGSFGGIVTATIGTELFQKFYATFDLGHDGAAALLRDDGAMLVRQPYLESATTTYSQNNLPFRFIFPDAANGSFEIISRLDGVTRILSYVRVAGYPLVVAMALGKNEQLAAWRAGAIDHLLATLTVAFLAGLFAVHLTRKIRLLARAEQFATESNTRLDQLARHLAQARDQADQANQAKSRFLTGITHELRTPLHGILGYAELMSLEGDLSPPQSERIGAMLAAGEHLLSMINAVLDMSQIEADRLELHPAEIELQEFARACLDVIRPAATAKGLSLALDPTGPLRLFADPTRLRQVLINLLGNAIKFTTAGSVQLRVRLLEEEPFIRMEVADTGPGIWAMHRDKLFQIFERLNAEAVSGIEGAGLGLSISARVIRFMGGRIGYLDNPGGGSVFWVELPVRAPGQEAASLAVEPARAANKGLHVLVVDDDALNRSIAAGFLRFGGHHAVCVDNGAEAVDAAADEDFDVILMDVRMPGMSGPEATRRIRALPPPRGLVRVVAVTAQAFAEQIEICRQAGMNSHVSKPFTRAVLLAEVEGTVSRPFASSAAMLPRSITAIDAEPELLMFDRRVFDESSLKLTVIEVEESLQKLSARCEATLAVLRGPKMPVQPARQVEDAHKLAEAAAALGFLSLEAAAHQFEVERHEASAARLAAAIEASVPMIRRELDATAARATSLWLRSAFLDAPLVEENSDDHRS